MILLIVLFLILFYIGFFIENFRSRYFAILFGALLCAVSLFIFLGYRYTADWKMYHYFFKFEDDSTDILFLNLTKLFKSLNLSYLELYQFHIITSLTLLILWISRFTKNVFFILLFYLLLDNVHFVNQIRYYLAFPFFLFGIFFLLEKKKHIPAVIFFCLALISHIGTVVLLASIPLFYIVSGKRFHYWILGLSGFVFVITFFIFNSGIGEVLKHFGAYLAKDNLSSFFGGLFNAIPYILLMVFFYIETIRMQRIDPHIQEKKYFKFLYKLSFFPVIFLPASFLIQIIGHRYVMPFAVVWLTYYYLFFIKDNKPLVKFLRFTTVCIIGFICGFSVYILPEFVFGESHFTDEIVFMVKSHQFLRQFLD